MKKVGLIFVVMLVLAVALGVGQSQAAVCDLTSSGNICPGTGGTGFNDGTIWEQITQNPDGTGNFQPFVRVQASPTEAGYNTSARPLEAGNEVDQGLQWTHSIQLGSLGAVTINGTDYYRFDLDINEPNNAAGWPLTLNTVEIYLNTDGMIDMYANLAGSLIYDMQASATAPNSVELNYDLEAGSGWGDMSMYIPVSRFAGHALTEYLYLYSAFGNPNVSADGFEEWRALLGGPIPPPNVPEPSTLLLLGSGLVGLGAFRRRFKK